MATGYTNSLSERDNFQQVAQSEGLSGGSLTKRDRQRRQKKRARMRGESPAPYSAPGTGQTPFMAQGQGVGSTTTPPPQNMGFDSRGQGGQGGFHPQGGMPTIGHMPGPLGNVNQPGLMLDADDPVGMFTDILGDDLAGSFATRFYGGTYNPRALGVALGKSNLDQDVLAFGQQLAQQLTGQAGMGAFMDPTTIVASLFNIASQITPQNPGDGPLASIATQNPLEALQTFKTALQGAVQALMPDESWQALSDLIDMYGAQYMQQWKHRPPEDARNQSGNIIGFIQQQLGPNFGLF